MRLQLYSKSFRYSTTHKPLYYLSPTNCSLTSAEGTFLTGFPINRSNSANTYFQFENSNPYRQIIEDAVNELAEIYDSFTDPKRRPRKIELPATICKVIEDTQTTNINAVRQSMAEWTIDLKGKRFKNKAEKFGEDETVGCIDFIVGNGSDKKLIKRNAEDNE